jgi:uncharacterized protein
MVRILVISDTHGNIDDAKRIITDLGPWDHVVHLGDSLLDAVELSADLLIDIVSIRGEDEYAGSPDYDDKLDFEAGGKKFHAQHGHRLNLNSLIYGNEEFFISTMSTKVNLKEMDIFLFGHTHTSFLKESDGVLFVNPGQLGDNNYDKTYAEIIVYDDRKPEANIYTV